jgi:hypothetical protein
VLIQAEQQVVDVFETVDVVVGLVLFRVDPTIQALLRQSAQNQQFFVAALGRKAHIFGNSAKYFLQLHRSRVHVAVTPSTTKAPILSSSKHLNESLRRIFYIVVLVFGDCVFLNGAVTAIPIK